jgi:hypothetical protein
MALRSDNGSSMTKHELAMAKGSAMAFTQKDTLRICHLIFHTFDAVSTEKPLVPY